MLARIGQVPQDAGPLCIAGCRLCLIEQNIAAEIVSTALALTIHARAPDLLVAQR